MEEEKKGSIQVGKPTETIQFFSKLKNEHIYMSNFHQLPFKVEGKKYQTVEHYYQSQKFGHGFNDQMEESVINASTPYKAFTLARKYKSETKKDV